MSVAEQVGVPSPDSPNDVTPTAELGEHLTPGFSHPTVQPYSIPVAGGYAYVCGNGHSHYTYGQAERCERATVDPRGACVACGGDLGEDNVNDVCGPCATVLR